jgi:hypothetical protein
MSGAKVWITLLVLGGNHAIWFEVPPGWERTVMQKLALGVLIAIGALALAAGGARAANLEGTWSGGGPVTLTSGARERAQCRVRYTRRSNEGYVVTAVCATASVRAVQTASVRKVADNRYRGTFFNREYGISGTITVTVRGNTQNVRLTSKSGWASLKLSR